MRSRSSSSGDSRRSSAAAVAAVGAIALAVLIAAPLGAQVVDLDVGRKVSTRASEADTLVARVSFRWDRMSELVSSLRAGMESRITFTVRLYEKRKGVFPFPADRLLAERSAARSAFWDFLDGTFVVESESGDRRILRDHRRAPGRLPDTCRAPPLRRPPRRARAILCHRPRPVRTGASHAAPQPGKPRRPGGHGHHPVGAEGRAMKRFADRVALTENTSRGLFILVLLFVILIGVIIAFSRTFITTIAGSDPAATSIALLVALILPLVLLGVIVFQFVRLLRQRALRQSGAGLRLRLLLFFTLISVLSTDRRRCSASPSSTRPWAPGSAPPSGRPCAGRAMPPSPTRRRGSRACAPSWTDPSPRGWCASSPTPPSRRGWRSKP